MPSDSAEILVRLLLKTSRLAAPAPPGEQVFRQAAAEKGGITHRKDAARHENVHRASAEGIIRHGAPHAHHAGSLRALKLRSRGIDGVEKVRIACIESDGGISALTNRETDRHRAAAAGEEKKTE